jgi:AcrR family transcriptional regulator
MRDVAAEAGVAQGLVHYYYSTKEALLVAVVRAMLDEQLARLRRELAGAPTTEDRALAGLAVARDRALGDKRAWRLFFEVLAARSRDDAAGELAGSFHQRQAVVAEEIARSRLAGREDPRTLALVLDALLLGLAAQRLAGTADGDVEAAYDAFVALLRRSAD